MKASTIATTAEYASRLVRVREAMSERNVDAVLISVGHALPYLTGYFAMPLERLTMLVIPRRGDAVMVVPRLEVPRVVPQPGVFTIQAWDETQDPIEMVAKILGKAQCIAIGDQMWARFLVELMRHTVGASFVRAVDVIGPLRMKKDAAEIAALQAAGVAADRVAMQLHAGKIPLIGRTEAQVSADISMRLISEGHDIVNFAIVAAGENAASPHHHSGSRVITPDEIVLCDFGGTMNGYCSDITRCVYTGTPSSEIADAYDVLFASQQAGVLAGVVGVECQDVDRASRSVIDAAGFGEYFVHRTGHGIGMEAHEDPYMVSGNRLAISAGHAFSVEPGIYIAGKWGMRLEDIVVATSSGPVPMNVVNHSLVSVDA
ncbi:MAG: Xaa-Pro peptidase family protein [Actinomycetota bacterium]